MGTTVVDTSLAYDKWKGTKYVLAFGDDLATRVIAHNGRSGQPVEPGTASGTNLANNATTPIDNPARANVANAPASSITRGSRISRTSGGRISFIGTGIHGAVYE